MPGSAKRSFSSVEALANPPLADVVALLARERLTGQAAPAAAKPLLDLFRAEVESKAGGDLDRLAEALRHFLPDCARNDVHGAACTKRHDDANRLVGPRLRVHDGR